LQVKGQSNLSGSRSQVWATLLDAEALKACLPGVQRFEQIGDNQWEVTMSVGLAGIKGTYAGRVSMTDQQPETSYRLNVEGQGGGNRVRGSGLISLADAPDGGTIITYDGDANIAGTLAMVGQRLFQPAIKMLADQFFKCMGSRVNAEGTSQ
jgi:carbon monoxide dehydrogenase subunit G